MKNEEGQKILIVVAHPDDEVLGCGGTITRYVNEGHSISVMILGEGLTSRDAKRQQSKRGKEFRLLKEQAKKANKLLGVRDVYVHNLPDNRFDTIAMIDIVKLIERKIEITTPEIIFTHTNCDLNIDHVITHRAVLTATRPLKGCSVKEIYTFEIPSSTEWSFGEFGDFKPNVFINIQETLEMKIQAMQLYETEIRPFPHPRSLESLHAFASKWGATVGLEAVESFQLIRSIR